MWPRGNKMQWVATNSFVCVPNTKCVCHHHHQMVSICHRALCTSTKLSHVELIANGKYESVHTALSIRGAKYSHLTILCKQSSRQHGVWWVRAGAMSVCVIFHSLSKASQIYALVTLCIDVRKRDSSALVLVRYKAHCSMEIQKLHKAHFRSTTQIHPMHFSTDTEKKTHAEKRLLRHHRNKLLISIDIWFCHIHVLCRRKINIHNFVVLCFVFCSWLFFCLFVSQLKCFHMLIPWRSLVPLVCTFLFRYYRSWLEMFVWVLIHGEWADGMVKRRWIWKIKFSRRSS